MEFDLISAISNVGFPIVVALYLLVKFEKSLKENTKTIHELHLFLKNGGVRNARRR